MQSFKTQVHSHCFAHQTFCLVTFPLPSLSWSAKTPYKQARNEVNNAIKSAKKQYFMHNLEVNKMIPRKTWKLIDDLSSQKYGRVRNISEVKVNNESITSAAEMAEVFDDFFATIWSNLASEIQPSTIEPEFYLQPTDTTFSLKPPSPSTVCRCLNQLDAKKATGLDRIPCKLLKLSSSIVAPSLAYIFKSCINAEIFPNEWKIAKVTPLFKRGYKRELGNSDRPISVLPLVSKIYIFIVNFMIILRIIASWIRTNLASDQCTAR